MNEFPGIKQCLARIFRTPELEFWRKPQPLTELIITIAKYDALSRENLPEAKTSVNTTRKLRPPNPPIRMTRIALSSGRTNKHIQAMRPANVIPEAPKLYLPQSVISKIKTVREVAHICNMMPT